MQNKQDEIYFRDGRAYPGLHRRYVMEHADSSDQTSAGQMWDFVSSISNNDLGLILRYKSGKMSRRMLTLTRRVCSKWQHMLHDIPGSCRHCMHVDSPLNTLRNYLSPEHLRQSPDRIARELKKLSSLRQLDTAAYADSVKKKRV